MSELYAIGNIMLNTTYKVTVPNLQDKPDMSFVVRIRQGVGLGKHLFIIDVEAKYIGSTGGNCKTFAIDRKQPMTGMKRMLDYESKILDTNITTVINTLLNLVTN